MAWKLSGKINESELPETEVDINKPPIIKDQFWHPKEIVTTYGREIEKEICRVINDIMNDGYKNNSTFYNLLRLECSEGPDAIEKCYLLEGAYPKHAEFIDDGDVNGWASIAVTWGYRHAKVESPG